MLVDCVGLVCVVCSCVDVSARNCARKRVRAWLPTCVRRPFAVLSCRPDTPESRPWYGDGGVLSNDSFISMFRRIEPTRTHTRAHARRRSSTAWTTRGLGHTHTHTQIFHFITSTKITNKEFLVIEELGGVDDNIVDFETTPFALVA